MPSAVSNTQKINQAWGFVYSEKQTDLPHMYLCDYKGTFWYAMGKGVGSIHVNGSASARKEGIGSKILSSLVQRKMFKIKLVPYDEEQRRDSVFPEEEDRIFIVPKQRGAVVVDGELLTHEREIHNGTCRITLKDHHLELTFEAFYDVSTHRGLHKLGAGYRFISQLGKGGYGAVFKALRIKGQTVCAIKTLLEPDEDDLVDEYAMLKKLKHESIIRILEFKVVKRYQFLVMEIANGGSLYYRIYKSGRRITESTMRHIFVQVSAAIIYLHKLGIIHRDLKPENIVLMTSDDLCPAKVIDFGLSCYLNDEDEMEHVAGAYRYMSPEMLAKKVYRRVRDVSYGKPIDVWGVGICCFIALTKTEPYEYSSNLAQYLERMTQRKTQTELAAYTKLSKPTKMLLSRSLEVDPKKRCKIEGLLELIRKVPGDPESESKSLL